MLRPLLLRGGSDGSEDSGVASTVTATSDAQDGDVLELQDESEQPPDTAMPSCWAGLRKLVQMVLSLLSPNYSYAKEGSELLGDASQQCGYAADDESWRTQRKKIHDIDLQPGPRKRVMRDLRRLKAETGIGVEVEDCEVLTDWVVKLTGAAGTVYEGEIYRLRVRFHADYPSQPPEIVFLRPAPVHEHIYSDGKICLNSAPRSSDARAPVRSAMRARA